MSKNSGRCCSVCGEYYNPMVAPHKCQKNILQQIESDRKADKEVRRRENKK